MAQKFKSNRIALVGPNTNQSIMCALGHDVTKQKATQAQPHEGKKKAHPVLIINEYFSPNFLKQQKESTLEPIKVLIDGNNMQHNSTGQSGSTGQPGSIFIWVWFW